MYSWESESKSDKTSKVGQAVYDLLSREQPAYSVEDILDQFGRDYLDLIRSIADKAKGQFEPPFYIFSVLKKDLGQFGVANVLKHSARPFQLKVTSKRAVEAHPGATKTLFRVDAKKGEIALEWSIPSNEECVSVLKHADLYDPQLVKWIKKCFDGTLDLMA